MRQKPTIYIVFKLTLLTFNPLPSVLEDSLLKMMIPLLETNLIGWDFPCNSILHVPACMCLWMAV